ncbi:MAG: hypothetical protein AAFQ68_08190, partial [Bacteroidota bacterium]
MLESTSLVHHFSKALCFGLFFSFFLGILTLKAEKPRPNLEAELKQMNDTAWSLIEHRKDYARCYALLDSSLRLAQRYEYAEIEMDSRSQLSTLLQYQDKLPEALVQARFALRLRWQ